MLIDDIKFTLFQILDLFKTFKTRTLHINDNLHVNM